MPIRGFFPTSRQRQSPAANVRVTMYTQRASHCHFLRKWRNDSSSGFASNFVKSLAIAKWKPFGRFSGVSTSHRLRSGTTDSKMAACRWRKTLVPVGPQQANTTNSLTKCGFWSCRIVMSLSENLRRGWGYMGVHSILTDDLTMRRESAKRTSSILANDSNFLDQRNIPVVHQSPYFLDMAPCDFWLSPHLKTQLKGTQFESRDDIIRNTTAKLYSIRKKVFQECFEQWRNRWENLCSVTRRLLRRGLGGCRPHGV